MLLSCLPCADMEVHSATHSSAEHASTHDNHSHDKENDLCSPFCICNCCGTQVLNYQPAFTCDFPTILKVIKTTEPFYKSVFSSDFYGSVWQPPQLV